MAYENVDVEKAKKAINDCLNSINHRQTSAMLSDLKGNSNWTASSKDTYLEAVDTLVNVRYKDLVDYLNKSLENLNNIEQVQKLQAQSKDSDTKLTGKRNELDIANKKYNAMEDKNSTEARQLKNRIDNIKSEMNNLQNSISSNTNDIASIQSKIEI